VTRGARTREAFHASGDSPTAALQPVKCRMTVDEWVFEAVESQAKTGASVRDIQRYIDEHHYEELAIDTIESSLEKLREGGRLQQEGTRWHPANRTSKEDALKKLFGDI
jgi:hypothetical protein